MLAPKIGALLRTPAGMHPVFGSGPGDDAYRWQAREDPPAPTLLLTSDEDAVVPAAGVRRYAQLLAATQERE